MDQGQPSKRPRLSTGSPSWATSGPHHGVSLPHPRPPPLTTPHHPHPPAPPSSVPYQSSPHSAHSSHPPPPHHFSRPQDLPHPPPPPQQHFDDRPQHEQERYPPRQDSHQPPPSPAHASYPNSGYPPGRDSLVKRDPEDKTTLPQLRGESRPGNGPEQLPPGPSYGHLPPQAHLEEKRQMSYENGPAPPPPPHIYRPQSYPHPAPPTPLPQHGQYEQPMYGTPQDGLYPIAYAPAGGKRKAQRASQACDSCRQLKAKCDENKPCKSCVEKRIDCVYREAAPKQQDKATQDVLDAVQKLKSETSARFADLEINVKSWVQEAIVKSLNPGLAIEAPVPQAPPSRNHLNTLNRIIPREVSPPFGPAADEAPSPPGGDASTNPEPQMDREYMLDRLRHKDRAEEDDMDEAPGPAVAAEQPAFPLDHTTPAGRLLQWPSIAEMVGPFLAAEGVRYPEDYPQRQELLRGQLPLFGRGEGSDFGRPADRDVTVEYGDFSDDVSVGDHASPAAAGTDWGPIGGPSPPATVSSERHGTIRSADDTLDFESSRIWKYVESYKTHIQNMHPLIPPEDLKAMIFGFLEDVGVGQANKVAQVAKFVSQHDSPTQHPLDSDRKRKRSPVPNGAEHVLQPPNKRQRPQRSIQHALVLIVLALGKICQVRDRKLPDVPDPREPRPEVQGSPVVRNGHITSPNQGSPPSGTPLTSSGLPSPKEHERSGPGQSRRSSVQRSGMEAPTSAASPVPPKKNLNLDVIPGLDYFAYATDILGNQMDGTKIDHIHAHILACLYYGQLGRVVASFHHIRQASHLVIDKLLPRMSKLRMGVLPAGDTNNKLIIAYWSCLQLETDILAELKLSPSTILHYENVLTLPNVGEATGTMGFPEHVIASYSAQLYLRKRLNEIHGLLYNPNHPFTPDNNNADSRKMKLSYIESLLFNHNRWLAPQFHFATDDEPSKDILAARIRAKFWGAAVITYRPFVKDILDFSYGRKHMLTAGPPNGVDPPPIGNYRHDVAGVPSVPVDAKTPGEIPLEVIEYAKKGIRAIIESTRAFHNLDDKRFVITNVFGTAHAQWGNLITLAAIYQDPTLGAYVDETQLRELFRRTIEFFKIVAQDSSSLVIDLRILEGLEANLPSKYQMQQDARATTSFSNGSSSYTPGGQTPYPRPNPDTPIEGFNGQSTPMEM